MAVEALQHAPVGAGDEPFRSLVRTRRQQHAHHDIVSRPRRVFTQQLVDEPAQPVNFSRGISAQVIRDVHSLRPLSSEITTS